MLSWVRLAVMVFSHFHNDLAAILLIIYYFRWSTSDLFVVKKRYFVPMGIVCHFKPCIF